MKGIILAVVIVIAIIGGGFYAWQSGLLNFQFYQTPSAEVEVEQTPLQQEEIAEETPVEDVLVEEVGEEQSAAEKIQEYKEQPTLCETDSDCKIIPITCNKCDCGRAVNIYIEPYACTEADKANPCNFSCPASKAVCEDGVCKKVSA